MSRLLLIKLLCLQLIPIVSTALANEKFITSLSSVLERESARKVYFLIGEIDQQSLTILTTNDWDLPGVGTALGTYPETEDEGSLDLKRKILGWVVIIVFVVSVSPKPFIIEDIPPAPLDIESENVIDTGVEEKMIDLDEQVY